MTGNASDKTTLKDFLKKIEAQYRQSERTWVMDPGIPAKETLALMRRVEVCFLNEVHRKYSFAN
jgi:transposase